MQRIVFLSLFTLCVALWAEARSFDSIFDNLPDDIKVSAFTQDGYTNAVGHSRELRLERRFIPEMFTDEAPPSFVDELDAGKFFVISENLLVAPINGVTPLAIYNALQNVAALKGIKYSSFTRGKDVPLFTEAHRIASPSQRTKINDLPPSTVIPEAENLFILVNDINFGNTIYESRLVNTGRALVYTLVNHSPSNLLFVRVLDSGAFASRVYIEPIEEGVLIYALAAIRVSKLAQNMVDLPSALKKRLDVLVEWAILGIQ